MSNLNFKDINSILNTTLKAFCTENGYDAAWELVAYVPTVGTIYLEQYFLPGQGEAFFHGDLEQGIYQVNVNTNLGDGRGETLVIVDAIRLYFGRTLIVSGKGRVGIVKSYLGAPQRDQSWYTEILNIQWGGDVMSDELRPEEDDGYPNEFDSVDDSEILNDQKESEKKVDKPTPSKSETSTKKLKKIFYSSMTSGQIFNIVKPKGYPTFKNKRQLCEWLEKEGKAIVEW